jgi:diguanylate cyclase (GGDEF)-like protein/putative nucleotidyltransferase with HDIG domain
MTPKVLIVDDVKETRDALAELLEASGDFEVAGEAADGVEAVERAAKTQPDLAIMDIRMPNMDGIAATRGVLAASPQTIVIAHTAYQDISLVRDMIAGGARGYVLKGSGTDKLLDTMAAALEGHAVVAPEVTRALLEDLQQLYASQVARGERLEEQVTHFQDAAMRDHLTGLGNHRAFHEELERALEEAGRAGETVAVAVLDIDDFKLVNDLYGHAEGDRLIQGLGGCVRDTVGERGESYRVGGDEMAVIMPNFGRGAAAELMETVRQAVSRMQFGSHRNQTISVGVAVFPEDGPNKDYVVAAADEAMYDAKSRGKDAVRVFGEWPAAKGEGQLLTHDDSVQRAVVTVTAALGVRDAATLEHCQRVSSLAAAIADELGLTPAEIETVRLGGLLHDIGKIGVRDDVLLKPAALDGDGRAAIERHPGLGRSILGRALPRPVLDCVAAHHEQPDGNGYPLGLKGEQIPRSAAIVRVADVFDALTREQPWRGPLSSQQALGEMLVGRGTQFDADAVDALVEVLAHGRALAAA